jgi:hypothetical protein
MKKSLAFCALISSVSLFAFPMILVPRAALIGLIALTGGAGGIIGFATSIAGILFSYIIGFVFVGGLSRLGIVIGL